MGFKGSSDFLDTVRNIGMDAVDCADDASDFGKADLATFDRAQHGRALQVESCSHHSWSAPISPRFHVSHYPPGCRRSLSASEICLVARGWLVVPAQELETKHSRYFPGNPWSSRLDLLDNATQYGCSSPHYSLNTSLMGIPRKLTKTRAEFGKLPHQ